MTKIHCYIDQPASWDSLARCVVVRGWCFASDSRPIRSVRLRVHDLCFSGVTGISRPDVKVARPDAPDNNTGFEIRGVLPSGRRQVVLEAQLADETWQMMASHPVVARRLWPPLWLGGGTWTDLLAFQVPCHMKHLPRTLRPEKFPDVAHRENRQPKFSIVTPSFLQAPYLERTLLSVLEQKEILGEYVVQDGGSSDGSVEIIRHHAQPKTDAPPPAPAGFSPARPALSVKLTSWESNPDNGQADAIARGFAKTSGEPDDLMAWINSDDFYLPGAFAFVADYFAQHPEVDVLYGHRLLVDEQSREIGRWLLPRHNDEVLRLYDFVPQETMFWRRRIWNRVGGLDSSFRFAMDWDLLLRFEQAGAKIVRVPYFLSCFRVHPAQKTSAAMQSVGQEEITLLRERTFSRAFRPEELENSPLLIRYLRRSAWIEFLWNLGIRTR